MSARYPMEGVIYPSADRLAAYFADGGLTSETLAGAYSSAFEKYASRTAITGPLGSVTYAELDDRSDRLGAAMVELGAKPLDRALFQLGNSPYLVVAVMACLKIGVIPICTLVNHREHEIGSLGRHAEARYWFVEAGPAKFDLCEFAQGLRTAIPTVEHVLVAGAGAREGQHSIDTLIAAQCPREASSLTRRVTASLDPFQPAVFQLSGGTTGLSKIIPRFSNEYLFNMRSALRVAGRSGPETVFCGGPFMHNAGFVLHWGPTLLIGGTIVIGSDLSEDGIHSLFEKYRPTWAYLPTPLVVRLAAAMHRKKSRIDSVQIVVTSAPASMVREEFTAMPMNVYGMAEGIVMMPSIRAGRASGVDGNCGMPVSTLDEVRLVRPETLEDVPDGEVGELLARGPYTLHGYYKADERNRASFTADGFLRTGDLMRKVDGANGPGYVFEGRLKDVIKRAGESIMCDELERAIREYPSVAAVAVVGLPDKDYGQRACACLIVRPGSPTPTLTQLGEHLRHMGFAKFKWPEFICVRDAFPLTDSGKLSKPLLTNEVKEFFSIQA